MLSTFKPQESGDEFVEKWKKVYNEYQWDTPHIAQAVLHTILGQLPSVRHMKIYTSKARYEDGRVHTLWMQPSGTGKNGGFNFVSDVCKNIELPHEEFKFETKSKFTSASLLGGPTSNRTRKYNKSTRENEDRVVIKPGILQPGQVNIFASQEIGPLFDSKSEHNEESMTWLQICMDPIGNNELTKDIQSLETPIKFFPECSMFFTSYIPTDFSKRTVQRGFVQRMILIINPIPISQRLKNMKIGIRGFATSLEDVEELQRDVRYLGMYMSYLNEKYDGVVLTSEGKVVEDNLSAVADQIGDLLKDLPTYQQEELYKFTDRALSQVYKIAWHHCILRGDTVVRAEDVVYAEHFLNPIWRQMVSYYEDALESTGKVAEAERTWEYNVINCMEEIIDEGKYARNGWVSETVLVDRLKKRLRKTKATIKKKIQTSVDSGLMERRFAKSKSGAKAPVVRMAKEVTFK